MTVGNVRVMSSDEYPDTTLTHELCRNVQQHRITVPIKAMHFIDYWSSKC